MVNIAKWWRTALSLFCCAALLLVGCGAMGQRERTEKPLADKTEVLPQSVEQTPETGTSQEAATDENAAADMQVILVDPYARAYYKFLQECLAARAHSEMEYRFRLVYIDEDAIPELLVFKDNSHAAGVYVYTYTQDKVAELGEFGSFGRMQYVEKGGMIFDHFMGQGESNSYFHLLKDGETEVICHLRDWQEYLWHKDETVNLEYYDTEMYYEIDDTSVTEDIYQAKWEELYDSQSYVLVGYEDGIPLREDDLLSVLAQFANDLWERDSRPVLEQVARQEETLNAYALLLENLAGERETVPFTLLYLDGDDIPELAVINVYFAEIYTFDQGQAVLVGNYGMTPEGTAVYREKEGIIFSEYRSSGGVLSVHQVNGTEDTVLQVFKVGWRYADGRDDDIPVYEIDDAKVSQAQYDEKLREWRNSVVQKSLRADTCILLRSGMNSKETLRDKLQTLILTQYDTLKENVLLKSGLEEDAILLIDYDDFDGDGVHEAFVFCGKSYYDYFGATCYSGDYWFAGADICVCLPERFGYGTRYRKIDGQMAFDVSGHRQKYLYYYSDYCDTADISGIWTVKNGEPVEVSLPQSGQVIYRGQSLGFELWADGYNNYYALPTEEQKRNEDWQPDDMWFGHTWRPYFYHYDWEYETGIGELKKDEEQDITREELRSLCGFDLVGEVEAAGYEVTAIVRWNPSDIVTINYTIPANENDSFPVITYENIIWDCAAKDYWRREERGVTSWENAGVGGSI